MDTNPKLKLIVKDAPIPAGWRLLLDTETQQFHNEIDDLNRFHEASLRYSKDQKDQAKAIGTENMNVIIQVNVGVQQPKIQKIGLNAQIPAGYRIMTYEEAPKNKQQINKLLGQWSIVAFDHGKLDGFGYGNHFSPQYGPECGEKIIIEE